MVLGGAAFVVGSVMQAAANQIVVLVLGRIMLGMGIGFANQVSCMMPCRALDSE